MRRLTAIILSIAFVISTLVVAAVPASAETAVGTVASGYTPEGTGIASLAEATDPAGKYYLTKDITVSETLSVPFTGTLDGNGHTVTVSAPIFETLSGTVKNLTIAGTIDRSALEKVHTGAIANTTGEGSTVVLENIKNTATVKGCKIDWEASYNENEKYGFRAGAGAFIGTAFGSLSISNCENTADITGYAAGGFVGYVESIITKDASVSVKDSKNSGKITSIVSAKVQNDGAVGGFIGITNSTKNLVFENLVNNGEVYGENVETLTKHVPAGGVVGLCFSKIQNNKDGLCVVKNVVNNAKVTGTDQVGGVIGWLRINLEAENLVNNGEIESKDNYAGGVFGRVGSDGIGTGDGAWSGSVLKNCENHGKVNSGAGQTGGVVGYTSAPAEFYNCVNTADISVAAGKAGGILGNGGTGCTAKFYSCINNGNIGSVDSSAGGILGAGGKGCKAEFYDCANTGNSKSDNDHAAGIMGSGVSGCTGKFYNCLNSGNVEAPKGDAGGICGNMNGIKDEAFAASKGGYIIDVRYCVNTGNIKSEKPAGGIVGRAGVSGAYGFEQILYCINTGSVETIGAGATALSNGSAGGIIGYAYGSKTNEYPIVRNCVSMGPVTAGSKDHGVACGVIGYFSSANTEITGNKVSATLSAVSGRVYVLAWDNNSAGIKVSEGNSAPEGCTTPIARKGDRDKGADDTGITLGVFDPATAVSGELIYSLNEAIKADTTLGVTEDVFFQTLGETFVPTVIPEVKKDINGTDVVVNSVIKGEDGKLSNPEFKEPTSGPDGPATPQTPVTGDGTAVMIAVFAVSAVAALGLALIPKKKYN